VLSFNKPYTPTKHRFFKKLSSLFVFRWNTLWPKTSCHSTRGRDGVQGRRQWLLSRGRERAYSHKQSHNVFPAVSGTFGKTATTGNVDTLHEALDECQGMHLEVRRHDEKHEKNE
jgi:hypothetical protein